jgi:hypothetical protein
MLGDLQLLNSARIFIHLIDFELVNSGGPASDIVPVLAKFFFCSPHLIESKWFNLNVIENKRLRALCILRDPTLCSPSVYAQLNSQGLVSAASWE